MGVSRRIVEQLTVLGMLTKAIDAALRQSAKEGA